MTMNKRGMRRPFESLDGEEWAELSGLQKKASIEFPCGGFGRTKRFQQSPQRRDRTDKMPGSFAKKHRREERRDDQIRRRCEARPSSNRSVIIALDAGQQRARR
jgi:hypothetical protein